MKDGKVSAARVVVEPQHTLCDIHVVALDNDQDGGLLVQDDQLKGMRKHDFDGLDWFKFCPYCGTRLPKFTWVKGKVYQDF